MPTFDISEYAEELEAAPSNLEVGTELRFENEKVKVWDLLLRPGERAAFHLHTLDYFWTCTEAGEGLQRTADGVIARNTYAVGDTKFSHTASQPMIHDLENVGQTDMRFVTVELKG